MTSGTAVALALALLAAAGPAAAQTAAAPFDPFGTQTSAPPADPAGAPAAAPPADTPGAQTAPPSDNPSGAPIGAPVAKPSSARAREAARMLTVRGRLERRRATARQRLASAKPGKAKPRPHVNQLQSAERLGFKKVSDLVAFPPFYPGLGIVTVRPDTLPMGPFRCFDRAGNLVATVYMPILADMNAHKQWDKVKGLPAPVDHVTMYFHPGHAGVPVPHYHIVLWHVKNESVVAK